MFKMKNKNFKKYGSSHVDIFAEIYAEIFAGNSKSVHEERLALECLFCKPCGIAVEFDNVVYITDIDNNRVNLITPLINTAEFLKYVGSLYNAFSMYNNGEKYELQANINNNFESYLSTLTQNIWSKKYKKLPKHLNCPEGSVAGVTMKSVQLISSSVNRLNEIKEDYSHRNVSLLSCLTLDVEYFHPSKHFKSTVLSMQKYSSAKWIHLRQLLKGNKVN